MNRIKKKTKLKKKSIFQLDGSKFTQDAEKYFSKNQTYLKEDDYWTTHIDLQKCVENLGSNRNPNFGYPLLDYTNNTNQTKPNIARLLLGKIRTNKRNQSESDTQKVDLPFQKALLFKRNDDKMYDHIFRSFTYGKQLKRSQLDIERHTYDTRVDVLKKRFKRMSLLRQYFAIKNHGKERKFRFPVNELAEFNNEKKSKIYDELQYCLESDIECRVEKKKKRKRKQKEQQQRRQQIDVKKIYRDDSLKDIDEPPILSSCSESDASRSLYSTPRQKYERDLASQDILMPFDYMTQRRTKQFFKEDILDIQQAMLNKEYCLSKYNRDEDEEEQIREVPELSTRLKLLSKVIFKTKLRKQGEAKLRLRGEYDSSSSDDANKREQLEKYNYAQKAQNIQIRDDDNELKKIFFQRTQGGSLKDKRNIYQKITEFKQNISDKQMEQLRNRSFVIVDVNSLKDKRKKTQIYGKSEVQQEKDKIESQIELIKRQKMDQIEEEQKREEEKEQMNMKEYYRLRSGFLEMTKRNVKNYLQKQDQKEETIVQEQLPINISSLPKLDIQQQQTARLPEQQDELQQQEQEVVHQYFSTHRSTKIDFSDHVKQQMSMSNTNPYIQQQQQQMLQSTLTYSTNSTISHFGLHNRENTLGNLSQLMRSKLSNYIDNDGSSTTRTLLQQLPQQMQVSLEQKLRIRNPIDQSPYRQIENSNIRSTSEENKHQKRKPMIIQGFLAERLKRQSILNSNIFKRDEVDYKDKVQKMVKKMNSVLGIKVDK